MDDALQKMYDRAEELKMQIEKLTTASLSVDEVLSDINDERDNLLKNIKEIEHKS